MKRYWKFHHRSGTVCHLFEDRGFFQVDPAITIWPWDACRDDISRPISSRPAAVVHRHKARKVRRGPEHPADADFTIPWKESTPTKNPDHPWKSTVYPHLPSKSTIHIGKYTFVPWMVWVLRNDLQQRSSTSPRRLSTATTVLAPRTSSL